MIVTMIECDSPACSARDIPEWVDEKGKKPPTGPYGWLQVHVDVVGAGPSVDVVACSMDCLEKAVDAALQKKKRSEEWS